MAWQLHEAKHKFSELVRCAVAEGPQVVTRHGEEVVVVLAAAEYRRLTRDTPDFREFLLHAPDLSLLDLQRERDLPRELDL